MITTIDCTPSPKQTKRMLELIIDSSTSARDRNWAREELLRCFPPVTVAVDQIHKYLIVGADVDRLKAYCAAVAGTHGAGNCDIYEFPEHDKRLQDIIDFLQADDCAIMHFDYREQLMPGAGS